MFYLESTDLLLLLIFQRLLGGVGYFFISYICIPPPTHPTDIDWY